MKVVENYRPRKIEFPIKTTEVPMNLGKFKTPEEAQQFINDNFVAIPSKLTTTRLMDLYEIEMLRKKYINELENDLPEIQKQYLEAVQELENAKSIEKRAKEMVNSSLNKIQDISREVKSGITEINLDQAFTYEVTTNGKRFYYTYIDKEIKLAKITEIPSYEQEDLLNSSEKNSNYFKTLNKAVSE